MRFWHRLALALGRTVRELQASMSSSEFTDWVAYARLEPFGYEMENWRAGVIASTTANVAPRKAGARPLEPKDFFPSQEREPVKYTTADAQIALFKALAGK